MSESALSLQSLENIRQRLLDLSKRNQLLNYKEKSRTLQITHPSLAIIFDKLVLESKNLRLVAQPASKKALVTDKVINVSREIFLPVAETEPLTTLTIKKSADNVLTAPYTEEILERRCKKLAQEARSALEETGSQLLYLAIGFLIWYEDKNSSEPNQAPLILIPVKLERTHLPKLTTYHYFLSYRDEEIETNISLAEKLANDFNLVLPIVTDEIEPEDYLKAIAQLVSHLPRWQVTAAIYLDFFSFTKLRMYQDLNDKVWPESAKLSENVNIKQLLLGKKSPSEPKYPETHLDLDPLTNKTPLILDADSSQQRVIMAALWRPTHLVVEGPPGTGKSQTITNLIAAALSQHKSVLFVAEKKAALDVVRNRLDQAELGEFCLELHSHKSQKSELHTDLRKRLTKKYDKVSPLEQDIEELNVQKQQLLAYSRLVNTPVGPNQEKIYEIFWKVERLRSELLEEPLSFAINNPFFCNRDEFNHKVHKLTEFAGQYAALSPTVIQDWQGFRPTQIWPGDEKLIHPILDTLLLTTQTYQAYLNNLITETKIPLEPTLNNLQALTTIDVQLLEQMPTDFEASIALALLNPDTLDPVRQFYSQQQKYHQLFKQAIAILKHEQYPLASLQQIEQVTQQLRQLGFDNESPLELNFFLAHVDRIHEELQSLLNNPDSVAHFLKFLQLRQLANQAPPTLILNKHPAHALETTRLFFKHAQPTFTQLAKQWRAQEADFLLSKLPTAEQIAQLVDELRRYKANWLAWLSVDYRQTKRTIKKFLVAPHLFNKRELLDKLVNLVVLKRQLEQETQREQYQQLFGPLFQGVDTDWNQLKQHLDWAQRLGEVLGSVEQAQELLAAQADPCGYLLKSTAVIYEQWLRVTKVAEQLKVSFDSHLPVSEFVEKIMARRRWLLEILSLWQEWPILTDKPIISIQGAVQNLLTAWQLRNNNQHHPVLKPFMGNAFIGIETDITRWIAMADWLTQLQTVGHLPLELLRWMMTDSTVEKIAQFQELLQQTQRYLDILTEQCQQLENFGQLNRTVWFKCAEQPCSLSQIIHTIQSGLNSVNELGSLATCYFLKQEIDKMGLQVISEAVMTQQIQPLQAPLHFQYAVYQSMARELIQRHSLLATFTRSGYENVRQRFAELDKKLLQTTRQHIAYQIAQRAIPAGNNSGRVGNFTEKALLEHELNKKRRHIPIRQLVRRASQALQAIKPCFMMSPLSVAHYLPPGQIEFDLLIMDEASQIRPEDALGAIARSKQIVIVGDPKQLPPTPFFERLIEVEDNQIETTWDGQESILDLGLNLYRKERLRWHYRSEHESLIAFSNQHFYDNELIVFPAPHQQNSDYGIQLRYVAGATYQQGYNLIEAEAVVAAVAEHFSHYPQLSLGVATVNLKQQELISDVLDQFCQQATGLEEQIKATETSAEPFFIKNLENVQGDERDVIFISTTYGPDSPTGRIFQRFGPINHDMGWRRLNVIFTRAKQRLVLFTALRSRDIHPTLESKRGVLILKKYLEYAESSGQLAEQKSMTGKVPDSDFEVAITHLLHQYGYQTVPQVGVAGFRIDIGVCHPQHPHEYILGIECDGASYHSAKSIRDRDRLRQAILERKGWKIYRIWSTDWFKNRETEVNRLLEVLASLKKIVESLPST
jgi:very-short-patch-repair endonuclease/DNA polymerase III delta prime subunit